MATPTTLPATFVSGNVLTAAQMNDLRGAFRVLQVVQTVKNDAFTTSSTTFTDLTGLSASITPSATSNKVLIQVSIPMVCCNANGNDALWFNLVRGSTNIFQGETVAGKTSITTAVGIGGGDVTPVAFMFLDSPSTTSSTTYKIQCRSDGNQLQVNRNRADTLRGSSSITVMEISA